VSCVWRCGCPRHHEFLAARAHVRRVAVDHSHGYIIAERGIVYGRPEDEPGTVARGVEQVGIDEVLVAEHHLVWMNGENIATAPPLSRRNPTYVTRKDDIDQTSKVQRD
jgi:hypothetical protein